MAREVQGIREYLVSEGIPAEMVSPDRFFDAVQLNVARKAQLWDQHMAKEKQAKAKSAGKPQVAKPGEPSQRQTAGAKESRDVKAAAQRLQKTGKERDFAAWLQSANRV